MRYRWYGPCTKCLTMRLAQFISLASLCLREVRGHAETPQFIRDLNPSFLEFRNLFKDAPTIIIFSIVWSFYGTFININSSLLLTKDSFERLCNLFEWVLPGGGEIWGEHCFVLLISLEGGESEKFLASFFAFIFLCPNLFIYSVDIY